jgi:hypothetical protein
MNKLALLFAAATVWMSLDCALDEGGASMQAAATDSASSPRCAISAISQIGRLIHVHHPLVDAYEPVQARGFVITICRRDEAGRTVTRAEAVSVANSFVGDGHWHAVGCKQFRDAEWQERIGEWRIFIACEEPLIPPPEIPGTP